MKWSMFTYHIKTKDGYIIYNFLNKGVIFINNKEYENILSNDKNNKNVKKLINQEFLIDNNINEKEMFMKSLMDEWENSNFLSLHILATTGCNFKCPYCYQNGIDSYNLNEDNLEKELLFLDDYISKNNISTCRVEITGGEATINWKIVEKTLIGLKRLFRKHKVKFQTMIVTNGYLFTSEKVDFIKKYNWVRLQVTIDGVGKVNNDRRLLKNNGNSFDKIIENLDYIIFNNKIKHVNLRINYDNSNILEVPKLLDYLKNRYGTEKLIISLGLITRTIDGAEVNEFVFKNGINENEFVSKYISLYKELKKRGFKTNDIFAFDGMCTSKLKHGFLFEPNGRIVKCVSGVGRDEFVIGNYLENRISDETYLYKDLYEECLNKECQFLPICHTGCRFESYINNKDKKKFNCKRKLLEEINTELIKINYMDGE